MFQSLEIELHFMRVNKTLHTGGLLEWGLASLVLLAVVCFLLNIKLEAYGLMLVVVKSAILQFSLTKLATRKSF